MRQHDIELRKCVHHAAEYQRRGSDAGLVRIAEKIAEPVLAHALGADRRHRMQEDAEPSASQRSYTGQNSFSSRFLPLTCVAM